MFYYALAHNLVPSSSVKLKVAFLPFAAAVAAQTTKQYQIVESNVINTAQQQASGLKSLVFSSGVLDHGSTVIITKKGSSVTSLCQLKGKKVGTVALATSYMLETRYVMKKDCGMNAALTGGDVDWVQIAAPTQLLSSLQSGAIDAVVANQATTYTALHATADPQFQGIFNVTKEFMKVAPGPSISSTFNEYASPDSVNTADIPEIQRTLAASVAYFNAHKSQIESQVASQQHVPLGLLKWEADTISLAGGQVTPTQRKWLGSLVHIGAGLGALKSEPALSTLLVPNA
jgi:hypothetical protein